MTPSSLHSSPTLVPGRPGGGAFGDQLALELGQGGENPEHQLAGGGGGVDRRPCPVSTPSPMPRSVSSCTMLTRCRRFRPSRSSFHTTTVSPARRAFRQAASCVRSSLTPQAVSSYSAWARRRRRSARRIAARWPGTRRPGPPHVALAVMRWASVDAPCGSLPGVMPTAAVVAGVSSADGRATHRPVVSSCSAPRRASR